ncbi:MAG: membrane protein insertase YidC [Acidimicrobiia bacterium]|nr:membrane protein insertase YidC [Acidimicrobiia bacterium]
MQWLFDGMANLLAIFYDWVPNYGLIIMLLTLLVMIVLTPLTLKGTRSMMMMQKLQPEIRKLQNKYKDDRQKQSEELMKFYRENNVNPVGGCLPLLAQAPVFIVLYTVLRGLTRRNSDEGYALGWAEGLQQAGAEPSEAPQVLRDFDPAYISPDTSLYQSLSDRNEMLAFGMDLSRSASEVLQDSIIAFIPFVILIAIVAVSGFVQQRQIQGRMSKDQVNPQQQMIMKFLPIFLPVVSFFLAGGLVLYFAVSNIYRVGQQWFISRSIYGLKRGETVDTKSKEVKPDGDDDGAAAEDKKGRPTPTQKEARAAARSGGSGKKSAKGSGSSKSAKSSGKSGGRGSARRPSANTGSRTAAAPVTNPVLQPRARKNKKR